MWVARSCSPAASTTARNALIGHTVPPPRLAVCSTASKRERGAYRLAGSRTAALACAPVYTPRSPSSDATITPLRAAGAPPSKWTMCEVRSAITSSPAEQWTRMAISLHIVPEGRNTARSLPRSSAAISHSRFTLGSSMRCSSPTGARAIASRMAAVGRVWVSL